MDYETGLKQVFVDYIGDFKYESYSEQLKAKRIHDFKFHVGETDGMDLFTVLNEYISDVFDEAYPDQEALDSMQMKI